jgi:hypothetical protein
MKVNIPSVIYFHIATIGKYQEIFDEIYSQILESNLINEVKLINLCIVGDGELIFPSHKKIKIYKEGKFHSLGQL